MPPDERVRLLQRLIESFEPEPHVRDSWINLSRAREARLNPVSLPWRPAPKQ
ncbi:hypothetical protein [Accumulibacter sp.]|uniref:addiction module protein n=1 Tax=Accumulibacter sp. TaxID=2053492 RepID=UPI0034439FAA